MPRSVFDPKFVYVPSLQTDIRKTFARIRREQKAKQVAPTMVLHMHDRRLFPGEKK